MAKQRKIVAIHLLNDFSGSPLVFSQALRGLVENGYDVDLYTSKTTGTGFLSDIPGVDYFTFNYRWNPNKVITLIFYLLSQLNLFFSILKYRKQPVTIYVNSVLPFGAALAGKIMGKRVVYHVHETSIKPLLLKKFLFGIVNQTASDAIFVSEFLKNAEPLSQVQSHKIYNALPEEFTEQAHLHKTAKSRFTVLMLCSLKAYKGVNEFVNLAARVQDFQFELVLNATEVEIGNYFKGVDFTSNLKIYPAQSNVHPFYARAHVVLNLSHPDKWVETFGMTALEAMAYRLPVIVPPAGGIAEIVTEGSNGYQIDSRDLTKLVQTLSTLQSDTNLYQEIANNAFAQSSRFSKHQFITKILPILSS